ncbi:TRAP transporter small permease [Pseudoflavonifractor phocaeensis]|uniref:TRAP transporter small permease n=1 Tax=Pseudoflavonifractor phocaeensis TaxID=1870988 RepID=UPI00309206F2|nr:C4-dicarboxylate ABC transporter permease [Oscillospiraceae bacterium]
MQAFTAVKRGVDKVIEWLCIIILAVMTVLVTYQVVTRYFFSKPSAISETLAQYLFVWMIMYGSAYVFGLREHLDITTIKDKLHGVPLLVVELLINVVLILFAAVVLMYGGQAVTAQQMGTMDAALQIPMGVIYSAIPISGVFILFYAIYNIFLAFHNYKSGVTSVDKDAGSTM